MSNSPFRFVHAADFRLDVPLTGVDSVPPGLADLLLDAPWWAAERVLQAAVAEKVDFVVLAGGLLHPLQTGPRGPLFLIEQFERLAERGIGVYWAGGREDTPENWPAEFKIPPSVHRFPTTGPEGIQHVRDGATIAHLVGASRSRERKHRTSEFTPDPGGLFSIAVVHGNVNPESLRNRPMDYWALGGSEKRGTPLGPAPLAHYPGTPQGRNPQQPGPHGCTLVQVDAERRVRTSLLPCDALRWQSERVLVDPSMSRRDLETRLHDRMLALRESQPGVDLLVRWTVAGVGPLFNEIRRGKLGDELLERLRKEHGGASPAAWSLALEAEPPALLPPEWYEQDSFRGDFLRELRRYQSDPSLAPELEAYLSEPQRTSELAALAQLGDARDLVLREAAVLGVDLLSGEGPRT